MQELIGQLAKQLGVSEQQAQGGAGLLFKAAQEKLGGDFSQVASKLTGVQDLIKSAPAAGGAGGGLGSLLGGLASAVGGDAGKALGNAGGLAQLAGGFSQLKLDPSMISKFVPVILQFVQSKYGGEIVALLQKAMK